VKSSGRILVVARFAVGSKRDVEDGKEGGEIAVGVLRLDGMMKAVPLRSGEDPCARAQRKSNIHVHEESEQAEYGCDPADGDRLLVEYQSDRHQNQPHTEGFLQPVMTQAGGYIDRLVGMMQLVQWPCERKTVLRAMEPVVEEIVDEKEDQRL